VLAMLGDEDRITNARAHSMAASIIGSSAMLAKPGESLAPILGWVIFYKSGLINVGALSTPSDPSDAAALSQPRSVTEDHLLLCALVCVPLLSLLLQLALCSGFKPLPAGPGGTVPTYDARSHSDLYHNSSLPGEDHLPSISQACQVSVLPGPSDGDLECPLASRSSNRRFRR